MMNKRIHNLLPSKFIFLVIVTWVAPMFSSIPAQAASSNNMENRLGYGARINLDGSEIGLAVDAASAVNLDWIAVDFNWSEIWPDRSQELNLSKLDMLMQQASDLDIKVMISITNPPEWLVTKSGPDPEITAWLLVQLARLYPQHLKAVELFPGANTKEGWGAPANPSAYFNLLHNCTLALQNSGSSLKIVSAGLILLPVPMEEGSMQDTDFLEQLYQAGAGPWMPVIGVRIPATDSQPLTAPQDENSPVLRHYEVIREIMLANQHAQGLIWVTGFSWQAAQDTAGQDTTMTGNLTPNQQMRWLEDAYQLMRSQLYIEAIFLGCLNSPIEGSVSIHPYACLIETQNGQTSIHPALQAVSDIIIIDHTGHTPTSPTILTKQMFASLKALLKAEEP